MTEKPGTDLLLIKQVLGGDQHAYSLLVTRYSSYVFTLVLRYVNDREQAEELAQDVFVKAYRMLASFKGESKFSTWLYTIVHTTCLSYLRKNKPNTILLEPDQFIVAAGHTNSYNTTTQLEEKHQKKILDDAIKQLGPIDAHVITLFYLAEQSLDEISGILNLSRANVKVRLYRSRQKLKELLTTHYRNSI